MTITVNSLTLSSSQAGATGVSMTIQFTPTVDLEPTDNVRFELPVSWGTPGFVEGYDQTPPPPNPNTLGITMGAGWDASAFCYQTSKLVGATTYLQMDLYSFDVPIMLAAGTPGTITIPGFTNPAAGTYAASGFSVYTNKEAAFAHPPAPIVIDPPPATPPGAPTITDITPGDQQLTVEFTAPEDDGGATITTYQYSTDGGNTWLTRQTGSTASPLVITTLSADGTTALTNGVTYSIKLRAVNSEGAGTASGAVSGTPAEPADDPRGSITTSTTEVGTVTVTGAEVGTISLSTAIVGTVEVTSG